LKRISPSLHRVLISKDTTKGLPLFSDVIL
jgi:hypothetical protein